MKLINLKIILLIAAITQIQTQVVEAVGIVDEQKNLENKLFSKKENVDFYMFASLGLSDTILRQMFDYAKIYNGAIVLRGAEDNSFKKTPTSIDGKILCA